MDCSDVDKTITELAGKLAKVPYPLRIQRMERAIAGCNDKEIANLVRQISMRPQAVSINHSRF